MRKKNRHCYFCKAPSRGAICSSEECSKKWGEKISNPLDIEIQTKWKPCKSCSRTTAPKDSDYCCYCRPENKQSINISTTNGTIDVYVKAFNDAKAAMDAARNNLIAKINNY